MRRVVWKTAGGVQARTKSPSGVSPQHNRSIASHPNLSKIEDIELHTTQKHIRLRGTVGSFFEKQLVGETIRELDKDRLIENELSVSWD